MSHGLELADRVPELRAHARVLSGVLDQALAGPGEVRCQRHLSEAVGARHSL